LSDELICAVKKCKKLTKPGPSLEMSLHNPKQVQVSASEIHYCGHPHLPWQVSAGVEDFLLENKPRNLTLVSLCD
jgi:hypothetical protein